MRINFNEFELNQDQCDHLAALPTLSEGVRPAARVMWDDGHVQERKLAPLADVRRLLGDLDRLATGRKAKAPKADQPAAGQLTLPPIFEAVDFPAEEDWKGVDWKPFTYNREEDGGGPGQYVASALAALLVGHDMVKVDYDALAEWVTSFDGLSVWCSLEPGADQSRTPEGMLDARGGTIYLTATTEKDGKPKVGKTELSLTDLLMEMMAGLGGRRSTVQE